MRHREYNYLILKRIAENHPAPELKGLFIDDPEEASLADPELANQEDPPSLSRFQGVPDASIIFRPEIESDNEGSERAIIKRQAKHEVDEDKEPMKFHAINPTPLAVDEDFGRIGSGEWSDKPLAPNIHQEPEITIRGNRIELTFTKSVRMTASPDTPHQKLLDIITLLKDL